MKLPGKVMSAVLIAFACTAFAQDKKAEEPKPASQTLIEDLGDDRYRIGNIVVDKNKARFSLPAKVLHLDEPLEYLAVQRNGAKGYESLLELDTTAQEFQLAAILVGLDEKHSVKPRYQFDEREAEGQLVEIDITWGTGDNAVTVSAATALLAGDEPMDDDSWVYVGSVPDSQGARLMAEVSGAVIGFVHDPMAIIDHRTGAGIGAYGSITGNAEMLPPEGGTVTLTVTVVNDDS